VRTRVRYSKGMPKGGSDEDTLMPVFPEPNDRDLDGGTRELHVGQPLDTDRRCATDHGRRRYLARGPGIAHGLAGVRLTGDDELGAEGFEAFWGEDQVVFLT